MPTYDFKCGECEKVVQNRILRISHTKEDLPTCCNSIMGYHITKAPMVCWTDPVIEPFRNPAAPRGSRDAVIQSKKQRKEFMAKNDLVDANDFIPVSRKEDLQKKEEMQRSIDAITPTGAVKEDMEKRGLLSIVD